MEILSELKNGENVNFKEIRQKTTPEFSSDTDSDNHFIFRY